MPPSWHPVPVCVPQLRCRRNHSSLPLRRLDSDAERCCGRDRCYSGGFLFRIMPPSWHPVPACAPRLRCRRTVLHRHDDCAASIRKSGPEIKNRCTNCPCFDLLVASILKSGLEFKNHCSAIVPASRIARLHQYLPQRCRVRFQFSSLQSIAVPPA